MVNREENTLVGWTTWGFDLVPAKIMVDHGPISWENSGPYQTGCVERIQAICKGGAHPLLHVFSIRFRWLKSSLLF